MFFASKWWFLVLRRSSSIVYTKNDTLSSPFVDKYMSLFFRAGFAITPVFVALYLNCDTFEPVFQNV